MKCVSGAVIGAAFLLSGCASIINGSKQDVRVTSQPSGATVRVDDRESGMTPVTLNLARRTSHRVEVSLNNTKPYEMTLSPTFNPTVLGNLFFGGIIGFVVDSSSGAANTLKPDRVDVVFGR